MATTNKPQAVVDETKGSFTLASVDSNEPDRKTVLSEGTRDELARNGHSQSPFSGALLVGSPDNYRVLNPDNKEDQAEYTKVARENAKRRNEKKESNLL